MRTRARAGAALALSACLLLAACLMPKGRPVYVDRRAGKHWSGNGRLLEVSEDQRLCRVALRSTALIVEKKWVSCRYVHADQRPTGPTG